MNSPPAVAEKTETNFSGLRVIGFESRRAYEMESLIARHGGDPRVAPTLREIPYEINSEAIEFAKRVVEGRADVVILLTGVGTRFLLSVIEKFMPREQFLTAFSKTLIVARGPKPVRALKEIGLCPTIAVPEPNTWRELLKTIDEKISIRDKKVFVQEYGIENKELLSELKKRGAHLSRVPVYRWALPEDLSPLKRAIQEISDGKADILLFTNAAQVHHLLQVASEEGLESSLREALGRVVIASIGPVTSENLAACGLPVDFESSEGKMGILVQEAAQKCPELLLQKRAEWEKVNKMLALPERHFIQFKVKPFSPEACRESLFLKACRREKTSVTPIWIMRQAGRYMKEYRQIRSRVGFLELCKNSDLVCELTVTAQEKLGVDAAIIFSDILLLLEPMGVGLEFTKGEGPYIYRPVRSDADVDSLRDFEIEESLSFVLDAIKKTRSALKPEVPLIGFAGAPFTLLSYLIEGRASENYLHTKTLIYKNPQTWHKLMKKMTRSTAEYMNAQIESGVQAVQLFDSWVGCLSPADYREYVFPHMQQLFASLKTGIPIIHFGTGTAAILELMRDAYPQYSPLLSGTKWTPEANRELVDAKQTGHVEGEVPCVIGLDWRVDLNSAWQRLGNVAVQGNLDPMVLLSDWATIREKTKKILEQAQDRPGHIFNLGHGILPQTPFENAVALVEIVHEMSSR